jgi:hypothetical protein
LNWFGSPQHETRILSRRPSRRSMSRVATPDTPLSATTSSIANPAAGMLGSVVSLLLRLSEFESTKGRSQRFLTLTGATLPLIGGVFGAFVAVLLSAKVVNISIGTSDGTQVWLYIVIGFLSGFSERFSRGFIAVAETQFGSPWGRNTRPKRGGRS